jgi:hypothetical protein
LTSITIKIQESTSNTVRPYLKLLIPKENTTRSHSLNLLSKRKEEQGSHLLQKFSHMTQEDGQPRRTIPFSKRTWTLMGSNQSTLTDQWYSRLLRERWDQSISTNSSNLLSRLHFIRLNLSRIPCTHLNLDLDTQCLCNLNIQLICLNHSNTHHNNRCLIKKWKTLR